MNPVVFECLRNAQAVRRKLAESRGISLNEIDERLVLLERGFVYLLAGFDYLARADGGRSVLFDTLEEFDIKGIGPEPGLPWPGLEPEDDVISPKYEVPRNLLTD